jgi:TolB-like protein
VPAPVADVIMRALEKEPDERPQSADEILQQLGGTSTSGPVVPADRSSSRWRTVAIAAVALLVTAAGIAMWRSRDAQADTPIMLAVLPFENQGPAEQDYFVDGLTDAVNGKLAGVSGISVIDRRSTAPYRKTTKPVKQIGSELGVQYVLGAVVRWAKGDAGWRAQVMPTLVDTRNATTRWAGEPLVVSSADPFSAQTEIAQKVVDALQLALGSEEQRNLVQKPTDNPQAYDAYLRGKAIMDAVYRTSTSVRDIDQAASEFQRAVTLDPTFAKAWAMLSVARFERSTEVPSDTASMRLALEAARQAEELDADDPYVVSVRSGAAFMQGDPVRGRKIVSDAVKKGIFDADLLIPYAFDLVEAAPSADSVAMADSARKVIERAIRMSPRDPKMHGAAAELASMRKDWAAWETHARNGIALDPTDERGWSELASRARNTGDTVAMRKAIDEALKYIPSPSNLLLVQMVYSGNELGSRFMSMTPEQLRIETIYDSVSSYLDNKADFHLRSGNMPAARAYLDSIITKVDGRFISGVAEPHLRLYLANAFAQTGRNQEAARELERARASARSTGQLRRDGTPSLNPRIVAAVLGALGRHDEAVHELRVLMALDGWTRAGIAREPKMRTLWGNPTYEAFLREKQ